MGTLSLWHLDFPTFWLGLGSWPGDTVLEPGCCKFLRIRRQNSLGATCPYGSALSGVSGIELWWQKLVGLLFNRLRSSLLSDAK